MQLNPQQFGEQLHLFGSPAPRYEQLQMDFPPHPPAVPPPSASPASPLSPFPPAQRRAVNWAVPESRRDWESRERLDRALGGFR